MNTDDYMTIIKATATLFALVVVWNIFKANFTD
jgi:hypothetical protein